MNRGNYIIDCYEYVADGFLSWPKRLLGYAGIAPIIAERKKTHPQTLRKCGQTRVINRTILEWSDHLGTYGMGGPGFYGLRLASTTNYPEEWFVLILWGAIDWLVLDEQSLTTDQRQTKSSWLTEKLIGGTIIEVAVTNSSSLIVIHNNGENHRLEIPEKPQTTGSGLQGTRTWNEYESQLDAWVITKGILYC